MLKTKWFTPLIGLAMVSAAGCASDDRQVRRPPAQVTTAQPRQPLPRVIPSSAVYVTSAASIDLFEIQTAELARQRSTNAAIREFALMMLTAHRGTSAQLSLAGRRLNLLPTATLNARHQRMLGELTSAANFDATYRRQQAAIHQEALALHSNYAARGASPTLRPVAAAMVPIIERHIRMLGYL